MEFIKKNVFKLIFGAVLLTGLVLTGMLVVNGIVKDASLGEYTNSIAISTFLTALAMFIAFATGLAYVVLKMFSIDKVANYVLLAGSVVAFALALTGLCLGLGYSNSLQDSINTTKDTVNSAKSNLDSLLSNGAINQSYYDTSMVAVNANFAAIKSAQYDLTTAIFKSVINVLVFGLMPLIYSVKNLVVKKTK